jgi:hypothetical protein
MMPDRLCRTPNAGLATPIKEKSEVRLWQMSLRVGR